MDIGLFIGTIGSAGTLEGQIQQIVDAEEDGFDSFWIAHIMDLDVMSMIGMAAQRTDRIRLGTAVTPTFLRHPIAMAQQAITIQAAAQGRFVLGMGVSHKPVVESRFGLEFEKPAQHMREYLEIVKSLATFGRVDYQGEIHTAISQFTSQERPNLPIVVAALGDLMLRNAGELADGTVTWMVGAETIRTHIAPKICKAAIDSGKPKPKIIVALPVCVTDNKERAIVEAGKYFGRYGELPSYRAMIDLEKVETPAELAVIGNEEEVEEELRLYAESGATEIAAQIFPEIIDDNESVMRTRSVLRRLVGQI